MKKNKCKYYAFFIILCFTCFFMGCDKEAPSKNGKEELIVTESKPFYFGNVPNSSYEVPESKPGVLVNQVGYESKRKKTVIFRGEKLGNTFEVVDAKTEEVVFTGDIKDKGNGNTESEQIKYGYFTQLEQAGTYYIRTQIIGESYPFRIGEDVYKDLFYSANKTFMEHMTEETEASKTATSVVTAMLALEFYPEVFGDDFGMKDSNNGIPDMLDTLKQKMELYLQITPDTYHSEAEASLNAGILAKFYNLYKAYDLKFASECLKMSEKLWNYGNKQTAEANYYTYFAASELYRTTGNQKYHAVIKANALNLKKASAEEELFELLADITYLSTRRTVDIEICSKLMQEKMDKAEQVATKARNNRYLVSDESVKEGLHQQKMLSNVSYLLIIDHIITSHEYGNVAENQLHYFLGCNEEGMNYQSQLEKEPLYLFMMCEIKSRCEEIQANQ